MEPVECNIFKLRDNKKATPKMIINKSFNPVPPPPPLLFLLFPFVLAAVPVLLLEAGAAGVVLLTTSRSAPMVKVLCCVEFCVG